MLDAYQSNPNNQTQLSITNQNKEGNNIFVVLDKNKFINHKII